MDDKYNFQHELSKIPWVSIVYYIFMPYANMESIPYAYIFSWSFLIIRRFGSRPAQFIDLAPV